MSAFKFACCLIQFGGEEKGNLHKVLREVAEAGWDGVEGLRVSSADELVHVAAVARRYGLHWVNMLGQTGLDTVSYNITLGNTTAEIPALSRRDYGGDHPTALDYERAARSLDEILGFCTQHGIKGFHHAHLRTLIETVEDAESLLSRAPDLWLLLDTGHLIAAQSDPMRVFGNELLRKRIGHVHLKDFHADDPAVWDRRTQEFGETARFAELGQGNAGLRVASVLESLQRVGYDGWVSVELDRPYPPKPAAEAAVANRKYLASLGY